MATCRDIIKRAFRKLGVIAAGADPSSDQMIDAQADLVSLFMSWVGLGMFGRTNDTLVLEATYTAREQDRIMSQDILGSTITLPYQITNAYDPDWPFGWWWWSGSSAYGYGWWGEWWGQTQPRPPRDGALVVITDLYSDFRETFVYDGQIGRWVSISGPGLSDECPFSTRYADGIACSLALILAPEYGQQPQPSIVKGAQEAVYAMGHRYDRAYRPLATVYF